MTTPTQGRLWIRLIKKHRILKDTIVPCDREDPLPALALALPPMDLSQPLWLARHQSDWDSYALTRFMPDHFLEAVPFDHMEISYIAPEEKKPKKY